VLGLRSVARFAIYVRMLALAFLIRHIDMASFAGFVSGKPDGMGGNIANRGGAIVAILAKCFGNHKVANHQEY
jgi:hypothetical protein